MFERIKRLSLTTTIVAIIVIAAIALIASHIGGKDDTANDIKPADKGVTLAKVADLSLETSPLPLVGTVTSRSEATIRAESSGKLVVYKKLGDYVLAGGVIAEFENSSERAALLSAEGAYEAAKAAQGIAEISRGSAGESLAEAKNSALNALTGVYTTLDDAVRFKTDPAWRNPQTDNPILNVTISDSALAILLPQERTALERMLRAREAKNGRLTAESDLLAELDAAEADAQSAKKYLDDLSLAMSRAIADQYSSQGAIDGYKASVALARAAVNGSLSSISGARTALRGAISANAISEKNFSSGGSGVATADASVKSALGALNAAQARLEKTIVRSPIGGTINSLSIETGDFVSPYSEIAVVGNNGALEIVAYVTEDDAKLLRVGGKVTIGEVTPGVITRIASALDPRTKKIELRIGILGSARDLVNGATVRIAAERAIGGGGSAERPDVIQIPLSALKITPTGSVIFTVSASSTLVAHPVKEGRLLGERVVITEGLSPDMTIITDARGHKDGEKVTVVTK